MNQFRTTFTNPPGKQRMSLNQHILTMGSCFSDAIGQRLSQFKMNTLVNPFGIIYNPVSIHKLLRHVVNNEQLLKESYLQWQDIHLNYDVHSQLSALDQDELKKILDERVGRARAFLKMADWLVITYGTAWVYAREDNGQIVANCHKMPSQLFRKQLLSEKDIVSSFGDIQSLIHEFNPRLKIILTISPVRHLKDTIPLNQVSKSILRVACHTLSQQFDNVEYFPSYEIMMDDLRDYRFYKPDMIHPTNQAEEYIWEKFTEAYMNEETLAFLNKWKHILNALQHTAFHPESHGHQIFLQQTLQKLEELKPAVNVDEEIRLLKSQIKSV
jgi:hypothetical protein